jgi:predicted nucleic acid-binding protein
VKFVDTSFWVALTISRDANHQTARSLWGDGRDPLVTTNHVLGETWTFMRRRLGHAEALDFFDRAKRSPRLGIHSVDEPAEREAWRWLRRHDEREYSFVDATSFAMMRRLRVREAFAFGGDFSAAGFVEVRPPS